MGLGANSNMSRTEVPFKDRRDNHDYYVQLVSMFKTAYGISHHRLAVKLQISKNTLADRISGTIIPRAEHIYALENLRNELGLGNKWEDID